MFDQKQFEEDKQALADLIVWYRDKYHRKDFGHTDMVEQVLTATTPAELESIHRVVDGWLD